MSDKLEKIKDKDFFIRIPKSVATYPGLDKTAQYVCGALFSYVRIPSYLKKGIPLYTKSLALKIGIEPRVLQYSIKLLIELGIIRCVKDPLIKRRRIFLNVHHDDAYILIPHQVVKSNISIPSKMIYGLAFASRNGHSYDSINDIADYTNYHKSSVYRHIKILISHGLLLRDVSSLYRYLPNDIYSRQKRANRKNEHDVIYTTGSRASDRIANAPPIIEKDLISINPDDKRDKALDEIFKGIR